MSALYIAVFHAVSGGDDTLHRLTLIILVGLHGIDQIEHKVIAALFRNIDIGLGCVDLFLQKDRLVVGADEQTADQKDNGKDDSHHNPSGFIFHL